MKQCVLDASKACSDCRQCDDRCQLDPSKICDNCFRCLDEAAGEPYAEIPISGVFVEEADYLPEWDVDDGCDPDAVYRKTHLSTLPGLSAERIHRAGERPAARYPHHR